MLHICFFFFKQKTAYEMRISDWSSDVCSSDLSLADLKTALGDTTPVEAEAAPREPKIDAQGRSYGTGRRKNAIARVWIKPGRDRTSVVEGKSVSVRVDLGGRRIIKKKKHRDKKSNNNQHNVTTTNTNKA